MTVPLVGTYRTPIVTSLIASCLAIVFTVIGCYVIGFIINALAPTFGARQDANQAFKVDEAIRRARLYEPLNIGWLEEPLPADDVEGHARLARSTSIPIAIGESVYSPLHFRDYLQRGACSIVQVDVGRIGGITPWLKVAHLAECFNVAVAPHFLIELHVALCAEVPNARWVEYIPQLDANVRPRRIAFGKLLLRVNTD